MPARTVFTAPAQVDAHINSSLADPVHNVQIDKRIIVGRQNRIVIPAVAIHQGRRFAGFLQSLRHDDKGWNALAVGRFRENLPDLNRIGALRIRLIQHLQLIAGQLHQHRRMHKRFKFQNQGFCFTDCAGILHRQRAGAPWAWQRQIRTEGSRLIDHSN